MQGDVASVCARVTRTQPQNLLLGESGCRQAGGSERKKVVGLAHRGPEELLKPGRQEGRGWRSDRDVRNFGHRNSY